MNLTERQNTGFRHTRKRSKEANGFTRGYELPDGVSIVISAGEISYRAPDLKKGDGDESILFKGQDFYSAQLHHSGNTVSVRTKPATREQIKTLTENLRVLHKYHSLPDSTRRMVTRVVGRGLALMKKSRFRG